MPLSCKRNGKGSPLTRKGRRGLTGLRLELFKKPFSLLINGLVARFMPRDGFEPSSSGSPVMIGVQVLNAFGHGSQVPSRRNDLFTDYLGDWARVE